VSLFGKSVSGSVGDINQFVGSVHDPGPPLHCAATSAARANESKFTHITATARLCKKKRRMGIGVMSSHSNFDQINHWLEFFVEQRRFSHPWTVRMSVFQFAATGLLHPHESTTVILEFTNPSGGNIDYNEAIINVTPAP
jgi:hypothetical protein